MPRDAVSRTANVECNGGQKWVKPIPTTGLEDVQEFSETGSEKYSELMGFSIMVTFFKLS